MKKFKQHRDSYLASTVVETNRLVVRLEKVKRALHLVGLGSSNVLLLYIQLFRLLKEDTPTTSKQMKSEFCVVSTIDG